MRAYSINNPEKFYSMREAILLGQAPDGGLFMPENIPHLKPELIQAFRKQSFQEIALQVSEAFFTPEIPKATLRDLIHQAYDFDAPLKTLTPTLHFLELFHGPTLAFKDFGARFMAQLMSYYLGTTGEKLNILVATSGDTGGAVAAAFHKLPNITVTILYPSGKVSKLQELQLTTWGDNITALEIEGTFDDCQKFVKAAFLDQEFKTSCHLTSANSINIARLIPQSFYYFYAWSRLESNELNFIVPSGNLGNVAAGVIAKKMGLPVKQLIIATNANQVVPDYLQTGIFTPQPSKATLSNAMDVGNPSNLIRLQKIFDWNLTELKKDLQALTFSDEQTIIAIKEVYQKYRYHICPHTAVGYLASQCFPTDENVILATAHPNKFAGEVEMILGEQLPPVAQLEQLKSKTKVALKLPNEYQQIKATIQARLDP